MHRIVEEALRLVPAAEGATVELVDGDDLVFGCSTGSLRLFNGLRLRADASLSGLAVQTGSTLRCDDARTDPRVDGRASRRVGAVSLLCVPLAQGDRRVGVLSITAPVPHAFSDHDVATLDRLSSFVSAAIAAVCDLEVVTDALLSAPGGSGSAATTGTDGISEFVANVLRPGVLADMQDASEIERLLSGQGLAVVYQPIVDLHRGTVVIAEALSRFGSAPERSPATWFAKAWRAGLGVELELAAVARAFSELERLPDGCGLSVNLSPLVLTHPSLADLLDLVDPRRIVIELTEHAAVDDYPRVGATLGALRARGVRMAVDDAGAGFASLSHIVKLSPDIIKLDYELVHGIDRDPARQSLAAAIADFSSRVGADLVAEGIELESELEVARSLRIRCAQGFLLGRPGPIEALPDAARPAVPQHQELNHPHLRSAPRRGGPRWSPLPGLP